MASSIWRCIGGTQRTSRFRVEQSCLKRALTGTTLFCPRPESLRDPKVTEERVGRRWSDLMDATVLLRLDHYLYGNKPIRSFTQNSVIKRIAIEPRWNAIDRLSLSRRNSWLPML